MSRSRPSRRPAPKRAGVPFNARPFAGRPDEADLVALREIVPSATAPVHLLGEHAEREVMLATALPLGWPAMVRRDSSIVLSLQCPSRSGDVGIDLGQVLLTALDTEPGSGVTGLLPAEAGTPSLVELIAPDPIEVSVHESFDWWIAEGDREQGLADDLEEALSSANATVSPTVRLTGVDAAYWCRISPRAHLRWALSGDEEALLDGLARLHVSGGLSLGDNTKYAGAFRALGVLIPVWDLPVEDDAVQIAGPAADFHSRLTKALAVTDPLTSEERRARSGVVSRQITLH